MDLIASRPADHISVADLKRYPTPGKYTLRRDYDPHDDRNPSAKWSGALEGQYVHIVTILAHQHFRGEAPTWTVRTRFSDPRIAGAELVCSWVTLEMTPDRFFLEELATIESAILELEDRYKGAGY